MCGINTTSRSGNMSLARIALKMPVCCLLESFTIHVAGRGCPDSHFSCDGEFILE